MQSHTHKIALFKFLHTNRKRVNSVAGSLPRKKHLQKEVEERLTAWLVFKRKHLSMEQHLTTRPYGPADRNSRERRTENRTYTRSKKRGMEGGTKMHLSQSLRKQLECCCGRIYKKPIGIFERGRPAKTESSGRIATQTT